MTGRDGHLTTRTSELDWWLTDHLSPGTVLSLGKARWPVSSNAGDHVAVTLAHLTSTLEYEAIFDGAWMNDAFHADADAAAVVRKVFRAVKPGGSLVVTVPFGLPDSRAGSQPFYTGSVKRLLEPLFEITEIAHIDGQIAVAARRRARPDGEAVCRLDQDEEAFRRHELRLNTRLQGVAAELSRAEARCRSAVAEAEELRAELHRARGELARARAALAELRAKVALVKRWLAGPIAVVRTARRLRRAAARHRRRLAALVRDLAAGPFQPAGGEGGAYPRSASSALNGAVLARWRYGRDASGRDRLHHDFEAWLRAARAAAGDEVVVMFSGTTFVQERRGNRPIRMTQVYLERRCPVFFNYHRTNTRDPLPEYPDDLLCQSPIDATPALLERLLAADFNGKRRILFASFPHELMVRYLTVAAQQGWVTIYDARDDWEEFAKVGMARWYHPGYERYVAAHADIVSAVSQPLARKLAALAGGRTVRVVPNALDRRFPRPVERIRPAGSPVIGYFGHLTDAWFDWALVTEAAERLPDYTFELAGHQQPDVELPPNVKLLGLLGHGELAHLSRSWSLALVPFKNGPLADAVDPIKVYEYLHLGLPVLATYLPQCRDYPGTTITESREEFLDLLPELAHRELPADTVNEWLAVNTWQQRVDTYSALAAGVRAGGRAGVAALLGGDW
jgi:glycosyltransferase involved in cell wall biosynthesis/SAM-dependent methyltransferase